MEVQIPNPDGSLKTGSCATATILTEVDHNVATVPSEAPLTTDGVSKLLLADGEHFRTVAVTLGTKNIDWVEVIRPLLPPGSQVVTSGQVALVAGEGRR